MSKEESIVVITLLILIVGIACLIIFTGWSVDHDCLDNK